MLRRLFLLFRTLGREIFVLWYACRHPATPRLLKFAGLLLGLYVLSPVDLITDMVPLIGWIDDVTLLAFGVPALLRLMPEAALRDAHADADGLLSRLSRLKL